jgi:endonuclease YncB( thermonuclease family)
MRFSEHLRKASLVGAFFVFAFFSVQTSALCRADGPLTRVDVARALDGDTLRLVDGRNVRLIGINTPELGRKDRRDEPFAVIAQQRLQALVVANGGRLGLRLGQQAKDHYGRTLAHAFDARGDNLEAALLAEGLGFFVAISPNTGMAECHRAAEQQARRASEGLWQRSPSISVEHLRRAGFALVKAKVERLERNRGGVWLEMQGSFVIQIPQRVAAAFDDEFLERLAGQEIEARGWVTDRKGRVNAARQARWKLSVTHPSMLQSLH